MKQSTETTKEGQSLLADSITAKGKDLGYGTTEESLEEHQMFVQDGRRFPCLDIARIVCVGLVVVNHGGSSWSDGFGMWNTMYVQQWVLQWLFIVCGMSFGMSSKNTQSYLGRLIIYFGIGVITNWSAWAIAGKDWQHNFWDVIFQFWFIFGLMLYIVLLTPLKSYLKSVSTRTECPRDLGLVQGLAVMVALLIVVHLGTQYVVAPLVNVSLGSALVEFKKSVGAGGAFWGLPDNTAQSGLFISELLGYIQVSMGSIVILLGFPRLSNRLSLTNWILLAHLFICRGFLYRGQFARIVDGFDWVLIGLANFHLGLSYRRTIGKYMCRYWFFVLFVFACLVPPGTWGRFDETPIQDLSFRIRFHLIELACTLLFLCAIERIADGAIFLEDNLQWLSWWSLYLFLFHKAIHIVVPHPFNWAVIILIAPIAWFIHGRGDDSSSEQALETSPAGDKGVFTPRSIQEDHSKPSEPEPEIDVESALEDGVQDGAKEPEKA